MMRFSFYSLTTKLDTLYASHLTQCHGHSPLCFSRFRRLGASSYQHSFNSSNQIHSNKHAHSLKSDSINPCHVNRQELSEDDILCSSSLTLYRCDDISDQAKIYNSWKPFLHRLRSIVDSIELTDVTLRDMTSVRAMMEQSQIVKLYIRPYSYNSDDIITCEQEDLSSLPSIECFDVFTKMLSKNDESTGMHLSSVQTNYINNFETESLRIAMMLSNNLWWNGSMLPETVGCTGLGVYKWQMNDSFGHKSCASVSGHLLMFADKESSQDNSSLPDKNQGPNQDQLWAIQEHLIENLPKLFWERHNYNIYTKDIIFENSWYSHRSYTTVFSGVLQYVYEICKLRLNVHLKFANVKMRIIKATSHTQDGTVRIRWRISGIPHAKAMMFWKYFSWNSRPSISKETEWMDGFSIFYADNKGLIYKHKMDRVIPDDMPEVKVKVGPMDVIKNLGIKLQMPTTS